MMATEAVWDVGLFDLVDGMWFVEFYYCSCGFGMWVCVGGGIVLWVCLIWWMFGVGCGFGMWVCLVWWMVCADLSGFFFLFFIEVALVDVRQWLLVAVGVVVAVVIGGRCCRMVVGPGLVMKMMMIVIGIRRRKYIILLCSKYYFNV